MIEFIQQGDDFRVVDQDAYHIGDIKLCGTHEGYRFRTAIAGTMLSSLELSVITEKVIWLNNKKNIQHAKINRQTSDEGPDWDSDRGKGTFH